MTERHDASAGAVGTVPTGTVLTGTVLTAADGHAISVYSWLPPRQRPVAVLQIFHGLAEHAARYGRFAKHCADKGYVVVAHDHRGHGPGARPDELGHFADRDGWNKLMRDAKLVQDAVRQQHPELPLLLLGHSMGSYIAQAFVMRYPDTVQALLLSGSTLPPRLKVRAGRWVARLEMLRFGARYRSERLRTMGFGAFNERFSPTRTDCDWLSRDAREVDKYIADPYCGATSSAGLWHDLLGGLLDIGSVTALRKVPADLPILITGGELDPVGGAAGMGRLAAAYERSGHTAVMLNVYAGGRHEMLNEVNRDAVTADVLAWLESARTAARHE